MLGDLDQSADAFGIFIRSISTGEIEVIRGEGGRFNGAITGERRPAAIDQPISSGASRGRDVLGGIAAAFGATPSDEQAHIEANVELVETLRGAAVRNERRSKPTALVLPIGSCADEDRWLDDIVTPLFEALRFVAPIAWVPFAALWFGTGIGGPVLIIFTGAFPPCLINAYRGARFVETRYIEAAQTLGVSEADVMTVLESGDLKGKKIGSSWRISRAALTAYMSQ